MRTTILLISTILISAQCANAQHDTHRECKHTKHVSEAGMRFIQNDGQWPEEVKYRMNSSGASTFLQEDGILWTRLEDGAASAFHNAKHDPNVEETSLIFDAHAWKVKFVDAQKGSVRGHRKAKEYHNYFLGDDQDKWRGGVPLFEEVVYQDLWSGVDMRWYGIEGNMKYDLLIDAGVGVNRIGFEYEGLDQALELKEGVLLIPTSVGTFKELAPVAWYADNHEALECAYVLKKNVLRFKFPKGRDITRKVIIDPLLVGATYSGMTGDDIYGHCATFDDAGNIYSGGQAFGPGLPASVGAFQASFGGGFGTDINVNKFSADASTQIWATYIGANNADEKPHSLIANINEELTVLGSSTGIDYPTTLGAVQPTFGGGNSDIVVTRLNAAGTALIGSTYMGGSGDDGRQSGFSPFFNYGENFRGEVVLDQLGNTFVASVSTSTDFPVSASAFQGTLGGQQDGVVFGLNPSCTALFWSTYIGGTDNDNALGLRFTDNGDAVVVGGTASSNFPTTAGSANPVYLGGTADGYLARITNGGNALAACTHFGTSSTDACYFVDIDSNDDIYVYGQTNGTIPVTPAGVFTQAGGEVFVAKLDPMLTTELITTPIGGDLTPVAFLVDVCDHIYISGFSPSGTWQTTPDAQYPTQQGFYHAAFESDMDSLLYGSYYGGSHVDGGTSRFDKNGIIYQGVCSGGNSMPTSAGAFAPSNLVGWDIGVFKIDFQVAGVNAAGAGTQNTGCAPVTINFVNNSIGNSFIWDFGDGSPLDTAFTPSHLYTTPGTYTVTLIATDSLACNVNDTAQFPILIGVPQPITAGFTHTFNPNCSLFQISTTNQTVGDPLNFQWDMGDGSPVILDTNVTHNYPGPGTYDITLIVSDPTGCSINDTVVQQVVIPNPVFVDAGFTVQQTPDCSDLIVSTADTSIGPAPSIWSWNMGDGSAPITTQNVSNYLYSVPGTYTISMVVTDSSSCNIHDTATTQLTVLAPIPITSDFTVQETPGCADLQVVSSNLSIGNNLIFDWDMGDGTLISDTNVTHLYTTPGTYVITLTVSDAWGCLPPELSTDTVTLIPVQGPLAAMNATQVNACSFLQLEGLNQSTGDSIGFVWNMGDGTLLTDTNIVHQYTTPGTYVIQLLVNDLTGCNPSDSVQIQVDINDELPVNIAGNDVLCPGATMLLNATTPDATSYLWNTGATTPQIAIDQSGVYIVTVQDSLCTGSDTITIYPGQLHNLFYELYACPQEELELTIPYSNGISYNWQAGGNAQTINTFGTGTYIYDIIDSDGCPHRDSIRVVPVDSLARVYAPNAFTPDGDGINDVFEISGIGERDVELQIFNRWGDLLHTTSGLGVVWDGNYRGSLVQSGVYVYRLRYGSYCEPQRRVEVFGHISVLR